MSDDLKNLVDFEIIEDLNELQGLTIVDFTYENYEQQLIIYGTKNNKKYIANIISYPEGYDESRISLEAFLDIHDLGYCYSVSGGANLTPLGEFFIKNNLINEEKLKEALLNYTKERDARNEEYERETYLRLKKKFEKE